MLVPPEHAIAETLSWKGVNHFEILKRWVVYGIGEKNLTVAPQFMPKQRFIDFSGNFTPLTH